MLSSGLDPHHHEFICKLAFQCYGGFEHRLHCDSIYLELSFACLYGIYMTLSTKVNLRRISETSEWIQKPHILSAFNVSHLLWHLFDSKELVPIFCFVHVDFRPIGLHDFCKEVYTIFVLLSHFIDFAVQPLGGSAIVEIQSWQIHDIFLILDEHERIWCWRICVEF